MRHGLLAGDPDRGTKKYNSILWSFSSNNLWKSEGLGRCYAWIPKAWISSRRSNGVLYNRRTENWKPLKWESYIELHKGKSYSVLIMPNFCNLCRQLFWTMHDPRCWVIDSWQRVIIKTFTLAAGALEGNRCHIISYLIISWHVIYDQIWSFVSYLIISDSQQFTVHIIW